jgi:hypothetical protein
LFLLQDFMASPAYADVVDTVTVTHRAAMKSEIRRCRHSSLQNDGGDLSRGAFAMRCSMGCEFAVGPDRRELSSIS